MTSHEYWEEVREIAESILDDVKSGEIEDHDAATERVWETIDGHQWVIYTGYHYEVLGHSDNDGYSIENLAPPRPLDEAWSASRPFQDDDVAEVRHEALERLDYERRDDD